MEYYNFSEEIEICTFDRCILFESHKNVYTLPQNGRVPDTKRLMLQ